MRYVLLFCLSLFSLTGWGQTNNELSFFIGPSISQNGNISKLGDPDFATSIEYNYFFNRNHGMGIAWSNEYNFPGSAKIPSVNDGSIHTWDIHYAFRHRFGNSNWKLTFTPGFGLQTLYDEYRDYYWGYFYYDDLSTAWVFDYKLMVDYVLSDWSSDGVDHTFFLGAGVQQIFSTSDDYRGQDISGNRLIGLFRIGVGF